MFIPFVVCGYLMSSLVAFDKQSLFLVFGVCVLTFLSSLATSLAAYGFSWYFFLPGKQAIDFCGQLPQAKALLTSYWSFPFQSPFTPSYAILTALILGFLSIFGNIEGLKHFAFSLRDRSTHILKTCFIPLLPLYVCAILLKMQSEGTLSLLFQGYGRVCFIIYGLSFSLIAAAWLA